MSEDRQHQWLEAVLDRSPTPLLLIECDSARVLFANAAAHRMAGGTFPTGAEAEDYHTVYFCTDAEGRRIPDEEMPGVRAARGERLQGFEMDWHTAGGVRSLLVASETVPAMHGRPATVVLSFEDVSELRGARVRAERAQRRAAFLAEAGALLASSLDYETTLETVARLAVPEIADWAFVEMLEPDGSIRRIAMAHADPDRLELVRDLDRRYPLDPNATEGSAKVIRTGQAELMSEIPDELLESVAEDDEHLRRLRELGFQSAMVVPLTAGGRTLGDIALVAAESGRRFGDEDLAMARELADRCALAVHNSRLFSELRETERELRRARDQREAILEGVADSVTAQDPSGRLVYANAAAVRMMGYRSAEALLAAPLEEIAARFEVLDEEGDPFPPERLPGRRALAGEDPAPVVVRFRRRSTGAEQWSVVKSRAIRDERGEVVLTIDVIEDVTETKEAERAQRFLAESSRILGSSLELETTLANVARLVVPRIADWCVIDVLEEDGSINRVATAHVDSGKLALAEELDRRYPVDPAAPAGVPNVLRTGRTEVHAEISDALLREAAVDGEHLELMRSVGMSSAMVLPMVARGRTLGALTLVSAESGRRFGERDLELAEDLARRAASAIDNARLFRERSHIARTLQASLLPPHLPEIAGVEIAAIYRAAGEGYEVGGDFYDVFPVSGGGWGIVIGDVSGKGADAAAVTALARYTVRAAAVQLSEPGPVLRLLNEAMLRQQAASGRASPEHFCTAAYGTLSLGPGEARLTMASGGHPLPLVVRADGRVEEVGRPGTLLGVIPEVELTETVVELGSGDALVLYTDGVTDARAPDHIVTPSDLRDLLGGCGPLNAGDLARCVERGVVPGEGEEPRDDIAILVLRVLEEGTGAVVAPALAGARAGEGLRAE